ncbi:MAG: protein translocase subunit SecD, partial [Bacteroidota bacterium]
VKNQLTRIVLIFAAVVLSVVFLWPTYQDYSYRQKMAGLRGQDSISYIENHQEDILSAKLKRIKLGLDLQGGMRVVLEVDILQLLDDLAKNKDDNFKTILSETRTQASSTDVSVIPVYAKKFQDRGIRLSRFYGNIRDEDSKIISDLESETEKAIDRAIEIVRNRVDQYRVSEPNIQKQGARRIIVELPGVKDENEVRQLLQGTAKLEFKLLKDPQIAYKVMESIDKFLSGASDTSTTVGAKKGEKPKEQKPRDALTELTGGETTSQVDTTQEAKFQREHPFFTFVRPDAQRGSGEGYVDSKDRDRVIRLLAREDIQRLLPPDFEFAWAAKPFTTQDGKQFFVLYPVKRQAELTGGVIVDARASVDPEDNRPIVNMEMSSDGAREWARITGANVKKRIAIMLDNAIFSAPTVENKIVGGRSRITGMDSPNEARLLEIVLKAGALPAPVTIIESRTVGPSLGEDSIRSGLSATAIAFIFTVLFMIVYYHSAGAVADFALLFNVLFILGVMAGFQATLTLPGIAGIVLTIGMAVDANVLINERIREEMAGGKTLRAAIDAGYAKAFAAIFDSNITTFLTGVVLYQFGTGPVQGFALTLMIGIAASMFSAIIITHVVFNLMIEKGMNPNFG